MRNLHKLKVPGYPRSTFKYLIYGHFDISYQGAMDTTYTYLIYGHCGYIRSYMVIITRN